MNFTFQAWVPVVTACGVGVSDYFADGSLTQMAALALGVQVIQAPLSVVHL